MVARVVARARRRFAASSPLIPAMEGYDSTVAAASAGTTLATDTAATVAEATETAAATTAAADTAAAVSAAVAATLLSLPFYEMVLA